MTAPWAALALLWGSLCAGEDGARRGGRGEGARGRFRAPRGVYQQRAGPWPLRPATCTQLAPPGAGTGGALGAALSNLEGTILFVRRPADPMIGPGIQSLRVGVQATRARENQGE